MMNKKQRAQYIAETLDALYPSPEIPLKHSDSYTLLIAVLLSAQSTDARVNIVTPKLFAIASTPYEMIKLHPDDIYSIIKPCGLGHTKAKAIWNLSKILIDEFDGAVPSNIEDLEKLPGVGHKTASVVMIQAFQKAAFPVDTHIHRCAKRWKLSAAKNVNQTERDLKNLFPKEKWSKLHLQIIYYAREFCPARGHSAEKCLICKAIS